MRSAADFADGAQFVSLAALQRPEDVPAAVVKTLAIVVLSGESADQAAERFLAAKHLLLVLDNFEHVLAAAPFIGGLLDACPAVTVLATSREPLGLHAEERYPVAPLALPARATPEDADALAGVDAVALFCARARARDPGFDLDDANAPAVAEICRRVDGLPLAIELAAARCGLLSPDEIAQRLDDALGAMGTGARDAPARQQTLRATIDWSHELLSDAEQAVLRTLRGLRGRRDGAGRRNDHARRARHARQSRRQELLVVRQTPGSRLGMLETIRAYAAERFASAADEDAVREDHYRYYLALAQHHGTQQALWGARRNEHLAQLDAESDNIDGALRWAFAQPTPSWRWRRWTRSLCTGRPAAAMRTRSTGSTKRWASREPRPFRRLACAFFASRPGLWPLGRVAEQPAVWAEAEAIARALGDPLLLSRALEPRVVGETLAGRLEVAEALADEALRWATTAGDEWAIAMAAHAKAMAASTIGELRERVEQAASLLDEVGNVYCLASVLASAAYGALCLGSDRDAKELPRTRDPDRTPTRRSLHLDAPPRKPRAGGAADRRHRRRPRRVSRGAQTLPRAGRSPLRLRRPARPCRGRRRPRRPPTAPRGSSAPRRRIATASLRGHRGTARRRPSSPRLAVRCGTEAWDALLAKVAR